MYEVVWQYDETIPYEDVNPANAAEARQILIDGNRHFANLFAPHLTQGATTRHIIRVSPQDVGISGRPGEAPPQEPFAAFLSCADARVPVEIIFGQQANDLFVVRVAGNVLGDECLGSLGFAVDQLGTVRLLAVLGHTGCGAVTATVDAYLMPSDFLSVAASFPLRTITNSIMAPVRAAAFALSSAYGQAVSGAKGYRQALIETAVMINSAFSAAVLTHNFKYALGDRLQVLCGVYDLSHRTVGLPSASGEWEVGLFAPPSDRAGFSALGNQLARSWLVRELLDRE